MKLHLLFTYLVAALWALTGYAQTTVTIGSGAAAGGTNDNGSPIYRSSPTSSFDYAQSVILYTQADLNGAGIFSGASISSIAFNKSSTGGMTAGATASLSILMQNTQSTSLSTSDTFNNLTSGFTTVYNNTAVDDTVIPAVAGYVVFTLSTPFIYTGGSLEIAFNWDTSSFSGSPSTGSFNWRHDTVPTTQARGTSNSAAITGALTSAASRRYQTQIEFTGGATCTSPPAGGTAVVIAGDLCAGSATTLGVTGDAPGAGSAYAWEFAADNVNFVPIASATGNSYTFNLDASTTGSYRRVETCGATSSPSTPISVSSLVIQPDTTPEVFDTYLPACWTEAQGRLLPTTTLTGTTSGWVADGFLNNGTTGSARIEVWTTTTDEWLISPSYNLTGNEQLVFDLGITFWNTTAPPATNGVDDKFAVVISTDDGVTWTDANTLRLWDNAGSPFVYNNISNTGETVILDLSAYTGRVRFGFYGESTVSNADNNVYIDNVQVRTTPSCLDVTSLTNTAVTTTTADFTWDSNNANRLGRFEYLLDTMNSYPTGPDATVTPTGTFPVGNVSASTPIAQAAQVTGLTPATTYDIYVREACSASDRSPWTSAVRFTTACLPVATFSENFDGVTTPNLPVCWSSIVVENIAGTDPAVDTSTAADNSAPNGARLYNGSGVLATPNDAFLISPELSTLGAGTHRLRFFVDGSPAGSVEVGTIADPTDPATFTLLQTIPVTLDFVEHIISFASYTGTDSYIAFRHPNLTTVDSIYLDDIVFEALPACVEPAALTVSSFTDTTVNLSWVNGNSSTVSSIEYGPAPLTVGTGTVVAGLGDTATITGLSPQTAYEFYVTQDCSAAGDGLSVVTGPVSATTACTPVSAPYFEDFELFNDTTNSTISNTCWTSTPAGTTSATRWDVQNGAGGTPSSTSNTGPTGAFDGDSFVYLETSSGSLDNFADLKSPLINLSSLTDPALSFYYHMFGATINRLEILVDNGVGVPTLVNTITGQQQTATSEPWLEAIVPLDAFANQTVSIIFRGYRGDSFSGDISIDAISVDEAPSCLNITSLTNTALTATTADFTWDSNNANRLGRFEYLLDTMNSYPTGPDATVTPTGTFPVGNVSTSTPIAQAAQLTGLTPSTTYDLYVREACNASDRSQWSPFVSFTTACVPVATFSENFDSVATPALPSCWSSIVVENIAGTDPAVGTSTAADNSAPNGARLYNGSGVPATPNDAFLISPQLSTLGAGTHRLRFFVDGSPAGSVEVGTITDPTDPSTFTLLQTIPVTVDFVEHIISFASYTGTDTYIAFRHPNLTTVDNIYLDDIVFEAIPACVEPIALTVSSFTDTTVSLSWVNGNSSTVSSIEYGPAPLTVGTGSVVAGLGDTATITGLSPQTAYEFYVTQDCSAAGDGLSTTTGPVAATTACAPVSAPYAVDFDTFTTSTTFSTENCWIEGSAGAFTWDVDGGGGTISSNTGPSGANTGTKYFFTESSNGTYGDTASLFTPLVDLSGLTSPSLSFYTHLYGSAIGTFEVFAIANGVATSVFSVTGQQQTASADPWEERIVDLAAFAGQTIKIEFRHTTALTGNFSYEADAALDDVEFKELPQCLDATSITVTNITATSASISWTENNTPPQTAWEVIVQTAGTPAPTATGATNATAIPFAATGLSSSTTYDVYVRTDCASSFAGPFSFTTLCATVVPDYLEDFTNFLPTCWEEATAGDLASGPSNFGSGDWGDEEFLHASSTGGGAVNINLWNANTSDWLISPTIDLSAGGYELRFDVGVTAYDATGPSAMGSDDIVVIAYSADNGVTWTALNTWDVNNTPSNTGEVYVNPLTGLNSATAKFAFYGSEGTVDDPEDFDFHIDNFVVRTPPSCIEPSALAATAITATSAQLSWIDGNATAAPAYDVEVVLAGTAPTGTPTHAGVSNPFSLTGLSSGTAYDYYVRAACSGGSSAYTGPFSFTTLAACGDTVYDTGGASGNYADNENYTVTYLPDAPGNVVTLNFTLVDLEFCCDTLEVFDGLDATAPAFTNDLEAPASFRATNAAGAITIRFRSDSSLTDIGWVATYTCAAPPSCLEPTALTATNITATSAQLSWTDGNATAAPAFDVEVVLAGTAPTGTPTHAGVSNPFSLTGLSPQTAYEFYVRAACSGTSVSNYTGPRSFTTQCAAVATFPVNTTFANHLPNSCWSEAGAGELAAGPSSRGASDWRGNRAYTNSSGSTVPSNAINLWENVDREWLISEVYDLGSGVAYNLAVEVAVTNWTSSGVSPATSTDTMGSDDSVILAITSDGGATWTPLTTWNVGNQPAVTGTAFFADLSAYSGAVQFAFLASDGTVDNTQDYDFHVGSFRIETTAGIGDDTLASGVSLYPNPVNGDELNIAFAQASQERVQIIIATMTGQVVRNEQFNQVSNTLTLTNMERLATGVYFVNVTQGSQTATLRFIKQ